MCSYLDMAKRSHERNKTARHHAQSPEDSEPEKYRGSKEMELGLAVQWAEEPGWIALRDPTTGEWHEVRASECLQGIVRDAEAKRKTGSRRKNANENR